MQIDTTHPRGYLASFVRSELNPLSLVLYIATIALSLAAAFLYQAPSMAEGDTARLMQTWSQIETVTGLRSERNDINEAEAHQSRALVGFIKDTWKIPSIDAAKIVRKAFAASKIHEVEPVLVLAVMAQESSFQHAGNAHQWLRAPGATAVDPLKAHGFMQVAGKWHPEKMPRDASGRIRVTTADENVRIGAEILSEYIRMERGNLAAALQRYNGNRSDETQSYAREVIATMRTLKAVATNA